MKNRLLQILLPGLLPLLLAACGGGGGGNDDGGSSPPPQDSSFSSISSLDANSDSVPIDDPDALVADIEALFGGPNDEPVQIGDDESLQDVIARLP